MPELGCLVASRTRLAARGTCVDVGSCADDRVTTRYERNPMNGRSDAQDEADIVYLAQCNLDTTIQTVDEAAARLGLPGRPGPQLDRFSLYVYLVTVRDALQLRRVAGTTHAA